MRIAIFSDNFYPELSGITDSLIVFARELGKNGHVVRFYAPVYSKKNFAKIGVDAKEIEIHKNVSVVRFASLPYPTATQQGRLALPTGLRFLSIRKFNPDIIYTNLFFGTGFEALFISYFLKKPLVGTNHTPITEFTRYSPIHSKFVDTISLRFVSWYYNRCMYVTAPSSPLLKEMKAYGFIRPSQALSNPIDIASFNPVTSEEKKKLKQFFGLSQSTILYTGRLALEKHIDVLIKALVEVKKSVPDATLALTGHGVAEKKLKELVKKLKIEDSVTFFGLLEMPRFIKLYQASDVFAMASTAETQSLSVMHAMACGMPVVAVDACGLPDYVNSKNGFLVPPNNPSEMAKKLTLLLKDNELRLRLGKTAITSAHDCSAPVVTKKWETIFENAIKNYS